jgi:hypothetical protein
VPELRTDHCTTGNAAQRALDLAAAPRRSSIAICLAFRAQRASELTGKSAAQAQLPLHVSRLVSLTRACQICNVISGTIIAGEPMVLYDEAHWPLVVVTYPPGPVSDLGFKENLRRLDEYAERGGPIGFVLDTRDTPEPDAARRRAIADYWDSCALRFRDRFIGAAIVMSSSTGRAIFKAISWLRNRPVVLVAVATPAEGIAKLRAARKERLHAEAG